MPDITAKINVNTSVIQKSFSSLTSMSEQEQHFTIKIIR